MLLLEWLHKNLSSATSHLFFLICIGFRFATELALKLLRLLSEYSNFSSQPILHLSSQSMYGREHSALLQFCLYVLPHLKPPSQPPNHFHLLLQISGTHCQIHWWARYYFENSIFILKIENTILFSIFKILFKTILFYYFQNSFKKYFLLKKIVFQNSFSKYFFCTILFSILKILFKSILPITGQIISHPFQLFLLLEELSNITCSCLLTLTYPCLPFTFGHL